MTFELRIQGSGDRSYLVKQGRDGVVYCQCGAWKFQRVAPALRSCKHIVKARNILQAQLDALQPTG